MSQYFPVVEEFLLSLADDFIEWYSNKCNKYSNHSDIGFCENQILYLLNY